VVGASTAEAQRDVATQIVEQVLDVLRGMDVRNSVNMPFQTGPNFEIVKPYMILAERLGAIHSLLSETPIRRIELEIRGELAERLIRPVSVALLKGLLEKSLSDPVNYVNAPTLAEELGITTFQTIDKSSKDYPNSVSCQVFWEGGKRKLVGVLLDGAKPRLVRVDDFQLSIGLEGIILILEVDSHSGVLSLVDSILGDALVTTHEMYMGRSKSDGVILSLITLGDDPGQGIIDSLEEIPAVKRATVAKFT